MMASRPRTQRAIAFSPPFLQDGNGRTGRIYANVALKTLLGLPFPVTITATVPQRQEYIAGLKDCRSRLLDLSQQPPASRKRPRDPVFASLIAVVVDRVAHAVRQFDALIATRSRAAAAEEEARAARRARERAAAGQWVIARALTAFYSMNI